MMYDTVRLDFNGVIKAAEVSSGVAGFYPGMLVMLEEKLVVKMVPLPDVPGKECAAVIVALVEDDFMGRTVNSSFNEGDKVKVCIPYPGDVLGLRIQGGYDSFVSGYRVTADENGYILKVDLPASGTIGDGTIIGYTLEDYVSTPEDSLIKVLIR